jgi:hypothetical protein
MMIDALYMRFVLPMCLSSILEIAHSAPAIPTQVATRLQGGTVTTTDGLTKFSADTARPFALAVEVLRIQYGAVICYEEAPYRYVDDIANKSEKGVARGAIPAGGELVLTYSADDVESVLTQLALTRSVPDRGSHFRLLKSGSVFMLLPLDVRDSTGFRSMTETPFDVSITMPAKGRGRLELLTTILRLVSEASKQQIVYMSGPGPDSPDEPTYQMSAQDEPARNVLLRALKLMETLHGPMAWDLMFDPASGKYFMNFTAVYKNIPGSATPVSTQPASIPQGPNAADSGVVTPH